MDIEVRRAEPSDAEALNRLFSQPVAIAGTLQLPFPSVEERRKRIAEPQNGYSLVALAQGDVVGWGNLWTFPSQPRRKHVGSFGMAVHDDWHGKGIGTALMEALIELADNWLGLTRLELSVFVDNEAAIHLYEKFQFKIEGTYRQFALRNGELMDALFMARLKS